SGAGDGVHVIVHEACPQQLVHEKAHAAGGMEVVDVRAAVRVDAGQQRYDIRQVAEVIPVDEDACGAGYGDEVQGVVGRAAGGEEAHDRVDDAGLVQHFRKRQVLLAEGGDLRRPACGSGRQRIAQLGVG